jgi:hypothetical protein
VPESGLLHLQFADNPFFLLLTDIIQLKEGKMAQNASEELLISEN